MTSPPGTVLATALRRASQSSSEPLLASAEVQQAVAEVCLHPSNRALARALLACCLAKVVQPEADIRKPYKQMGGDDAYSGREYDERYIGPLVSAQQLPCRATTAFLTPGLRTLNTPLTLAADVAGRGPYRAFLRVLDAVTRQVASADDVLAEALRLLLILRDQQAQRTATLVAQLHAATSGLPPSVEDVVSLVRQHLAAPNASRLPVLVVAALHDTLQQQSGERLLRLQDHHAADSQTGALGDVHVVLASDATLVTCYEVKARPVTQTDLDAALAKLLHARVRPQRYLFVTTLPIDVAVQQQAHKLYRDVGIEVTVVDALVFLRHVLHLFHALRLPFLNTYQAHVLAEPDSAVSQALKELWLNLRLLADADPEE